MVYTFPSYIPGLAVAVAVIAALTGWIFLRRRKPLVTVIVAFGVSALAGGIIAPMLAMDRVVLDDQKLEQTCGIWFAPVTKGFRLADVEYVEIGTARNRRGREYEVWIVKYESGRTQTIDPGDLWEMNGPDIIARLRAKGIEVRP